MFYSKLRWKIKDLEAELKEVTAGREHWRNAYNETFYDSRFSKAENSGLKRENASLKEEKVQLLSEMKRLMTEFESLRSERDELSCELVSAEDQHASAEKEIVRLMEENDRLRDLLRKKGGCPCDKRRKH